MNEPTNQPEFDADVLSEVEIEFAAAEVDVDNDAEAVLHKFVRVMNRLDEEEDRVRDQFADILKNIESRRRGCEFVYGPTARSVTEKLLVGKKQKSIKLPWGTVGFRKQNTKLQITHVEAVMAFARNMNKPDWIMVKEELVKSLVNTYFLETGDVPLGCEVVPESEKFYVKGPRNAGRANRHADETNRPNDLGD